jgi:hypothetical protein
VNTTTYLERVRAALADLPAEVREEMLHDLTVHLADVSAELGEVGDGALEERLGAPEAYAAELRSAAGLGSRPPADDLRTWQTIDLRLGRLCGYPSLGAVLRDLRPGWWVFRAMLATELFFFILGEGFRFYRPDLSGRLILWGTVALIASVASLRLGRAGAWMALPARVLNVTLVMFPLVAVAFEHWRPWLI